MTNPADDDRDELRARIAALESEVACAREEAAAARNEAENWRRFVESLPNYVSIFDPQGRFVYINRIDPEYEGPDYIGVSLAEVIDEKYWRPAFDEALATGGPTHYDSFDAAREHWYRCSVARVVLDDGRVMLAVISSNIDQLKRTEQELHDTRELWDSLVANSPDNILLMEPDSRVLFINKCVPGYTPEDVVGQLGIDFIEPPYRQRLSDSIAAAAATGKPHFFEFQDVRAKLWWHVTLVPVRDSRRGDLVLAISQDVTQRKASEEEVRRARDELELRVAQRTAELDQANQQLRDDIRIRQTVERALRESEERFRIIADTVPVAIVITRLLDGSIVYVNQRLAELFEVEAAQLLKRRSVDFYVYPGERDKLMQRLKASQKALDLELWLQSPGGKRLLVNGNYQSMVFDGEACVLTGFIDVTKRRETEQALLSERRFLNRLLELHDRDRQLISYEIHDGIVQDMTAAVMFLEASRPVEPGAPQPGDEAFANGLRLLRGSIDEARRLINGLRPPVLEDDGVVAAIGVLVDEIKRDANIEIEVAIDVRFQRLAPALEMAIYRIVQEGLNNVWHHSRSPKARVELVQRDDTVDIRVIDWGIGFDPAKVAKRRYGLMGMRERARLLKGRALVHSAPGQGTTLEIELPLIDTLMPTDE